MKMLRACRTGWFLALAGVLVLCLLPLKSSSASLSNLDKVEHAVIFLLLAWSALRLWPSHGRTVVLGLLAFGGLIELLQAYTPWRSAEALDWLADAAGVALAGLLVRQPASARRAASARPRPWGW